MQQRHLKLYMGKKGRYLKEYHHHLEILQYLHLLDFLRQLHEAQQGEEIQELLKLKAGQLRVKQKI